MRSFRSTVAGAVTALDWTLAAAGWAVAAVLAWGVCSQSGLVVLAGGFLLDGRVVSVLGLIGIGVLLLIGLVRKMWLAGRAQPVPPPPRSGSVAVPGAGLQWAAIGVALTFFTLLRLCGWFFGSDVVTLSPAAPGGCRVAAQETSALLSGSGTLFEAGGDWAIGHRILNYTVDDGARPFRSETYRLTWAGSEGRLVLSTQQGALATPNVWSVHCG
jgi:hypothetical protein